MFCGGYVETWKPITRDSMRFAGSWTPHSDDLDLAQVGVSKETPSVCSNVEVVDWRAGEKVAGEEEWKGSS